MDRSDFIGVSGSFSPILETLAVVTLKVQIDFGVGDVIVPGPRMIEYPVFLGGTPSSCFAYQYSDTPLHEFRHVITGSQVAIVSSRCYKAASGSTLLARRFNRPENHSEIVVLTGQAVDPYTLPQPVIVQPDTDFRKIVGTLFTSHLLPVPPLDPQREFVAVPDPSILDKTLKGARLFKVEGRSAEIVVLESLNPDGLTAAEVLSLDGSHSLPKITEALEVIGVLFELPIAKQ
jgi:hypothetical protein